MKPAKPVTDPARALDTPPACVCFNLRRAARALTQAYDAALDEVGLTVTQFALLAVLDGRGPVTVKVLAAVLGMDRTTLSRTLRPLARDGLIRMRAGRDQRERVVSLGAEGRRRLARAMPLWRAAQRKVIGQFGAGRTRELLHALSELGGAAAHV